MFTFDIGEGKHKVTSKGSPKPIFVETDVPKAKTEHGEPKEKRRKPKWELN